MKTICYKCGHVIDRDNYINGKMIEEYKNVFGTICPNCSNLIKPLKKPFINEDQELKMEILREEMIEKIRKKIKGEI